MRQQSGFTLIELIAVIVILGILAATAIPKFVNMQNEAAVAALKGVAGSLENASALNHAVHKAVMAGVSTDPYALISNCNQFERALQNGALPTGYVVAHLPLFEAADPLKVTCTLTSPAPGNPTTTFIGSATY